MALPPPPSARCLRSDLAWEGPPLTILAAVAVESWREPEPPQQPRLRIGWRRRREPRVGCFPRWRPRRPAGRARCGFLGVPVWRPRRAQRGGWRRWLLVTAREPWLRHQRIARLALQRELEHIHQVCISMGLGGLVQTNNSEYRSGKTTRPRQPVYMGGLGLGQKELVGDDFPKSMDSGCAFRLFFDRFPLPGFPPTPFSFIASAPRNAVPRRQQVLVRHRLRLSGECHGPRSGWASTDTRLYSSLIPHRLFFKPGTGAVSAHAGRGRTAVSDGPFSK